MHGAISLQDFHALAEDLATIERASKVTPHRLTDLSAVTAPYLTYPDIQAFVKRRQIQPLANAVKLAWWHRARSTLGSHGSIRT
jgi:hypothetical protein